MCKIFLAWGRFPTCCCMGWVFCKRFSGTQLYMVFMRRNLLPSQQKSANRSISLLQSITLRQILYLRFVQLQHIASLRCTGQCSFMELSIKHQSLSFTDIKVNRAPTNKAAASKEKEKDGYWFTICNLPSTLEIVM